MYADDVLKGLRLFDEGLRRPRSDLGRELCRVTRSLPPDPRTVQLFVRRLGAQALHRLGELVELLRRARVERDPVVSGRSARRGLFQPRQDARVPLSVQGSRQGCARLLALGRQAREDGSQSSGVGRVERLAFGTKVGAEDVQVPDTAEHVAQPRELGAKLSRPFLLEKRPGNTKRRAGAPRGDPHPVQAFGILPETGSRLVLDDLGELRGQRRPHVVGGLHMVHLHPWMLGAGAIIQPLTASSQARNPRSRRC